MIAVSTNVITIPKTLYFPHTEINVFHLILTINDYILKQDQTIHPSNEAVLCEVRTEFLVVIVYTVWHAVAYLVEALCYKLEGRGFDSRRGPWIFQLM
jgi:hypothetical protein